MERSVFALILETVRAVTGGPHRWDGEVAVVAGPVDDAGLAEYEDRIAPDAAALYGLGRLGWTWVRPL